MRTGPRKSARHRARIHAAALGLALTALIPASGLPGCAHPPASHAPVVPHELNERFLDPDLDVEQFVERFEGESREVAVHREAIAATLGLSPGQRVADVGAGTGLFLEPLARAVGPEGTVYAVDISSGFVDHMRARAEAAGLTQVRPVLCTERSVELAQASVDAVFVCDTYHHFGHPADTLASIRRALRPDGLLVIVDFERDPETSRAWILEHVRGGAEETIREIEAAGFRLVDRPTPPGLEETYVLRFRRT
ncbi:MAG: class I SAM-dependent methyltransferase [Planctomycetota bacterium]|jgi:cyclopropane fatty-acyl-phospholipid synthase-like methyltransferase